MRKLFFLFFFLLAAAALAQPNPVEALRALEAAEKAYNAKNYAEAQKHIKVAKENAPTSPKVQALEQKIRAALKAKEDKPTPTPVKPFAEPEMVYVEGGTFQMGCTSEQQDCDDDEKPVHSVTVSSFQIGKYEVSQKEWVAVMGSNPSYFKGDDLPVEQVSWNDVQEYIKKLNAKTGKTYRLPTEAEWEFAARDRGKQVLFGNGSNTADPTEMNFDASASYKKTYSVVGTYRAKTVPVNSFSPNSLGLYNMSGNVWEWCSDWYGAYSASSQTNPKGANSGSYRVIRGGGWNFNPLYCRVANRLNNTPTLRFNFLGFRLVLSL
jgi:formylglycine-generating enzyme required for sulfatase activity